MIIELSRFRKVVELNSLTKAAESLFISQPALTQSMHRLEESLNIKIFKYIGKQLTLTDQGKNLYEVSEKILFYWDKAKNIDSNVSNKYSIGLFDNAILKISSIIHSKITASEIEIFIDRSDNLLKKVSSGFLDACICVVPKYLNAFNNVKLLYSYNETLIPVAKKKWTGDLNVIPFILYDQSSQTGKYIINSFIKNDISPNVIIETTNPLFMKEFALSGLGVAILPENMVKDDIKDGRLFKQNFKIDFQRRCGVFINKDNEEASLFTLLNELISYL